MDFQLLWVCDSSIEVGNVESPRRAESCGEVPRNRANGERWETCENEGKHSLVVKLVPRYKMLPGQGPLIKLGVAFNRLG